MLRSTPGVQFGPRRVRTPSTYLSTPAQHRLQARSAWPKECLPSLFLLFESEPEHNCQWVKYPFGLPDATTARRDDEKSSARRVRPARAHRPPGNSQCSGARPSRREDRAPLRAAARPAAPAGTARQQRHRVPPRAPGGGATQPSAPPRRSQSAGASAFPPALRFRSPDAERATNAPGNRREMVPPLLLADAAEKAFPAIQRERGTANRRRTCCEWRQVQ